MKKKNLFLIILSVIMVMSFALCIGCGKDEQPVAKNFNKVKFDDTTVVYNGQEQTIELVGLPQDTQITYLTEESFVDVGTYSLKVFLEKDGYPSKTFTASLTITKAELTVTAKEVSVFAGKTAVPEYEITGFVGDDTIEDIDTLPNFTGGELSTEIGTYENAIKFGGAEDNNYSFIYVDANYTVMNLYNIVTENGVRYISFGEYPQTKVSDQGLIAALTGGIANGTIEADESTGWYSYNGQEYASLVARPHTAQESTKTFADGSAMESGVTYFFKVEPIKWKVISNQENEYFITTDLLIDVQEFHGSVADRTIEGNTIGANNWEYSNLRNWLNSDFASLAFISGSDEYIKTTTVDNGADVSREGDRFTACNDTEDKLFLLSYKDVIGTGFDAKDTASLTRTVKVSDYARAKGAYMPVGESGYWWLRNGADSNWTVCTVNYEGDVSYLSWSAQNDACCVRPAMYFTAK